MNEEPSNPFLDGSDGVPTDEAAAAAKKLAAEAEAARVKANSIPAVPKTAAKPAFEPSVTAETSSISVLALIIDAIVAAVAIAFTTLLFQDISSFLN